MAVCGKKTKNCVERTGGCGYRYTKEEYSLWECPRCGKDRHCQAKAGSCRVHGRDTPKGLDSPHFEGKGYSKHMPPSLQELHEEAQANPDRFTFRDKADLIDTLLRDLVANLEKPDSTSHVRQIEAAWDILKHATSISDQEARANAMADAIKTLGAVIERGAKYVETRNEIISITNHLNQAIERENRRVETSKEKVSVSEALFVIRSIGAAVQEEVTDDGLLLRIRQRFRDILKTYGYNLLAKKQQQ